jgi:hypothetical protein
MSRRPVSTIAVPSNSNRTRFISLIDREKIPVDLLIGHDAGPSGTFLPVFAHEFFCDEGNDTALPKAAVAHLARGGRLILDLSTEALVLEPPQHIFSRKLERLHLALEQLGVTTPANVCLLTANSAPDSAYGSWCRRRGLQPAVTVIGYDFYLFECGLALARHFAQNDLGERLLGAARPSAAGQAHRPKLFSCLNLRAKPHRYAVVAHLLNKGLLQRSTVSFIGSPDASRADDADPVSEFLVRLSGAGALLDARRRLDEMTPIVLDFQPNELQQRLYVPSTAPGVWDAALCLQPGSQQNPLLLDSYVDIVTESWFTDGSCRYLTEKTLRPLATLKPFLHVGTPFALKRLRELGFQTFSPFIDETYDEIADPVARMNLILGEVDRLSAMGFDGLDGLYRALWPRIEHNYRHLLIAPHSWMSGQIAQDVTERFASAA